MREKGKELLEELSLVFKGKTIDALFPPFVFVIVNGLFNLNYAVITAVISAVLIGVMRAIRRQTWKYALFGFLGVSLASGFAYAADSATDYFIPGIVGSVVLFLVAFLSVIVGRPLAAFASHLTRGWPIDWFWRYDVKPAYREVTYVWAGYLLVRSLVQLVLYYQGNLVQLVWANSLLGIPVTVVVLIFSYVYGMWRLKRLEGPGIEEFLNGDEPPYEGQKRGF